MHTSGNDPRSDNAEPALDARLEAVGIATLHNPDTIAAHGEQWSRVLLDWIRAYVIRPHNHLGRPGVVCPFVIPALQRRNLWISVIEREIRTQQEIGHLLGLYLELYDSYEPRSGPDSELKTFIIAFPAIRREDASLLIESVHKCMKPQVVERGLMLGEFFPDSLSPGIHNPNFYPLRSPVPLFVIRKMVPNDFVFLNRQSDPPEQRVRFIQAYISSLRTSLSVERLCEARDALLRSEREADCRVSGFGTEPPKAAV